MNIDVNSLCVLQLDYSSDYCMPPVKDQLEVCNCIHSNLFLRQLTINYLMLNFIQVRKLLGVRCHHSTIEYNDCKKHWREKNVSVVLR